jgi:hypothetical protein
MKGAHCVLGIVLAVGGAALLAACDEASDSLDNTVRGAPNSGGNGNGTGAGDGTGGGNRNGTGPAKAGTSATGGGPTPTDTAKAPDTAAKAYFVANVHPSLAATCGGCHETGPGPSWINKTDAEVSYKMMFQLGYVSTESRILLKGPHQTTQGLSADQAQKFTTWVQMELSTPGGAKPAPAVLESVGACFDRAKFDAMKLGDLRTIQRQDGNNTNNVTSWRENANNCTGCNNAPCRVCHSGDDATLFVNAIGNPNLPQDFTFEQSKLTSPAYVTKYFGVSPTGEPIASNALKIKANATAKDKAYSHPYFQLSADFEQRLADFVSDAVAKFKSTNGKCQ